VAVVALDPHEIANRLQLELLEDRDDLGEFIGAGFRSHSGRLIAFLRYKGVSMPGTTFYADARDDLTEVLREVLDLCRVDEDAVLWRNNA
jgi:hypothetical protein